MTEPIRRWVVNNDNEREGKGALEEMLLACVEL